MPSLQVPNTHYLVFRDPFANLSIISPSSSSSAGSLLPLTGLVCSALILSLSFCSALRCFLSALASNFASAASSSETRSFTIVLSMCSSVLRPRAKTSNKISSLSRVMFHLSSIWIHVIVLTCNKLSTCLDRHRHNANDWQPDLQRNKLEKCLKSGTREIMNAWREIFFNDIHDPNF